MMKRHLFALIQIITLSSLLMMYSELNAEPPSPIIVKLWQTAEDSTGLTENVLPSRGDNVRRITDIAEPSFTVYEVHKEKPTAAVLIFPGGGYYYLTINKEGTEAADWLNSIGITAIVVKYRVPDNREAAFQDAQRAVRLVRYHAGEWNIDPKRVGIIGFSSGGHLSARLSTDFKNDSYASVDEADQETCKPDYCILIYPAYLMSKQTEKLADRLAVTSDVPPTFIVQTKDDNNYVAGTIAFDQALKTAGVSSTFHLFPDGGHGYGLRLSKFAVSGWPKLCEKWLKENKIISDRSNKSDAGEGF